MARPAIPVNCEAEAGGLPVHGQPGQLNDALFPNKKWTQALCPLGEIWPRGQLFVSQLNSRQRTFWVLFLDPEKGGSHPVQKPVVLSASPGHKGKSCTGYSSILCENI